MTDSVEGSNVIPIPAKRVEGSKRNTTWTWVFNRETRKWDWKVTEPPPLLGKVAEIAVGPPARTP